MTKIDPNKTFNYKRAPAPPPPEDKQPVELPFELLPLSEQVSEVCYFRILEIAKVAFYAINRAYPLDERRASKAIDTKWQEAYKLVKQLRNFHKGNIRKGIIPLCEFRKHPGIYDDSQDRPTQELKTLVANQLGTFKTKLVDYAELIVPKDDVPSFVSALDRVLDTELNTLRNLPAPDGLASYEVTPRYKESDFE